MCSLTDQVYWLDLNQNESKPVAFMTKVSHDDSPLMHMIMVTWSVPCDAHMTGI